MENIQKPQYFVTVDRVDDTKVKISWRFNGFNGSVSIFRSRTPEPTNLLPVVENTLQDELLTDDPVYDQRHYYFIVPAGMDGIWAAERRIRMEGTVNFRDLGGYQNRDGRRIKWGLIFRGDSMQRATESDIELFRKLGIREVFDFRRDDEVKKGPNRLPDDVSLNYYHVPVIHGEFNFVAAIERLKKNQVETIKEETIIKGYLDNTVKFATTWGAVINQLAKEDCPPLYFHCTAGKDRTGICAALILSALNVPKEIIMADYLLSNPYIHEVWLRAEKTLADQGIDPKRLKPFFNAPESAMTTMLDHLETQFGSPLAFLVEQAAVNPDAIEALKKRVLE